MINRMFSGLANRFYLFFILVLFIAFGQLSCSSSSARVLGTWVNPEARQPGRPKVKKVFINVMVQNQEVKSTLESELADAAAAKGIQSEKSYFLFGPVRSRESLPPEDLIIKQIKKLDCDAIFLVSLFDQTTTEHYTNASTVYTSYPMYGSFHDFYGYSSAIYIPGYYTVDHAYFIQSNLYDTETGKLLISMQSKVLNPPSIEKSSKEYTKALIAELEKQGFLKK